MSTFMHAAVDKQVIDRARQGNRDAHRAIYEAYSTPVFCLIRRLVGSTPLAEELLHDVFVEVLTSCDRYRGDGPFGAWVRAIAVRKALMQLRSPWRRVAAPGRASPTPLDPDELSDGRPCAESAVLAAIELERALAQLPPLSRAVVWLHDVEGYTHAEIARALGRTISFSKSQLARAHLRLRECLDPAEEADTTCMPASTIC